MYERLKTSNIYPQNLIDAINKYEHLDVSIEKLEEAIASDFLDSEDNRYRMVLEKYFKQGMTCSEIGTIMNNTSKSRISQIIHLSIHCIRKYLRATQIHIESIDDANQYINDNRFHFSSIEDDKKVCKWRYTKPGGRVTTIASYDYANKLLTIY